MSFPAAQPSPPTVLIVEDEAMLRKIMTRTLEEGGYRVVAAEDGAAAWELLQRARGGIHAVITDVIMPNLGGVELARRVESLLDGPPVALVSGYAKPEAARDRPFLTKPFHPDQLTTLVGQLLNDRPL
jgi:two-component system, cell cycle sensor histidine kinase and response regulator CckA